MPTLRCVALALIVLLSAAAPASADTVSIAFKDTAGAVDPVDGIGRTLVITGNTPVTKQLYVKVRAPGGAPCAASAASDSGSGLEHDSDSIYASSSSNGYQGEFNGDFAVTAAGRWTEGAGTFMFCSWLASSASTAVTPITQQITFRAMAGTISGTVTGSPIAGRSATAAISGSSEGPTRVYAKVRRAGGAPCAATYSADTGEEVLDGSSVNGAFAFSPTIALPTHGDHVLCLWLADTADDPTPIAGPQPVLFTVRRP